MRHRAGSWKLGSTAGGPAGVVSPRPGQRIHAWIVAAIVAAHAAVVAVAWQPAAAPRPEVPRRMSMRLLVNKPAGGAVAAAIPAATAAAKPVVAGPAAMKPPTQRSIHAVARAEPELRVAPDLRVATDEPAVAVTAPIQGVAFAPPVIGFGPPPVRREASHPVRLPPPSPSQIALMQAQLRATRAQVADALEREVGTWQPPQTSQGACALAAEPESRLACDNDALTRAVAPREAALAGLLRAWRGMEPRTQGLTIAVVDGRYQASWN